MQHTKVTVPWSDGLRLYRAAKLGELARKFRSNIFVKCGDRIVDLKNVLGVMAFCAFMGTSIDVVAAGEDEMAAMQAIETEFAAPDDAAKISQKRNS